MSTRIKDIAKLADVSLSTVSLVLNNRPGVGQETRERILQLASKLRYEKPGASRLDQRRSLSRTIRFLKIARHGHTVNRDHNIFIADYIDGIVHGAKMNNYKIEISSFNATPIKEIVKSVQDDDTDLGGVIVLGTELSRDDVYAFDDLRLPLIFIDTFIDFVAFDFVDMDNQDSVYRAIEHFVDHGHVDIGMIRSSVRTRNFQLRYLGFREAMTALKQPVQEHYIFDCDSTYNGAFRDMRAIIQSGKPLPSALFCTNDIMAFGVLRAMRDAGYRIPHDVSVIGFDDLPGAVHMDPPLTSIAVSKWEIGNTAIKQLTHRMTNPGMPTVKVVIGGTLIERNSVKTIGT